MTKPAKIPNVTSNEPATIPIDAAWAPYDLEAKIGERKNDFTLARVPKYRSDLAFAAGFAALVFIFLRFSLIPWLNAHESQHIFDLARPDDVVSAVWFLVKLPLPGLAAPLALWLGMAGWLELRRHRDQSGKAPAAAGIIIGFLGTLILLFEIYEVAQDLRSILCCRSGTFLTPGN